MSKVIGSLAVSGSVLLACSTQARAAPDHAPETPFASAAVVPAASTAAEIEHFGTASDSVVTVTSGDFYFFAGTEGTFNLGNGARSCGTVGAGGICGWTAGLQLPTGAQIRGVEISACDSDPVAEVRFSLLRMPKGAGTPMQIVPFNGTGGTPGCTTFVVTVPAPVTVENDLFAYYAIFNSTPGTSVAWGQYRVRYRLQVSPAPAVATFPNDVPVGHPYFRFVEALAAAGVTGGCGAGSFCPDTAITRGQMAVFLASALGLHFPN